LPGPLRYLHALTRFISNRMARNGDRATPGHIVSTAISMPNQSLAQSWGKRSVRTLAHIAVVATTITVRQVTPHSGANTAKTIPLRSREHHGEALTTTRGYASRDVLPRPRWPRRSHRIPTTSTRSRPTGCAICSDLSSTFPPMVAPELRTLSPVVTRNVTVHVPSRPLLQRGPTSNEEEVRRNGEYHSVEEMPSVPHRMFHCQLQELGQNGRFIPSRYLDGRLHPRYACSLRVVTVTAPAGIRKTARQAATQ
jgi:hypothetical protein